MWGFPRKPVHRTELEARSAFHEAIRIHPDHYTVALAVTNKIPRSAALYEWGKTVRECYKEMERWSSRDQRMQMYSQYLQCLDPRPSHRHVF